MLYQAPPPAAAAGGVARHGWPDSTRRVVAFIGCVCRCSYAPDQHLAAQAGVVMATELIKAEDVRFDSLLSGAVRPSDMAQALCGIEGDEVLSFASRHRRWASCARLVCSPACACACALPGPGCLAGTRLLHDVAYGSLFDRRKPDAPCKASRVTTNRQLRVRWCCRTNRLRMCLRMCRLTADQCMFGKTGDASARDLPGQLASVLEE